MKGRDDVGDVGGRWEDNVNMHVSEIGVVGSQYCD